MANTLRYPYEDPDDYKGTIVFKVVNEDAIRQAAVSAIEASASAVYNIGSGEYDAAVELLENVQRSAVLADRIDPKKLKEAQDTVAGFRDIRNPSRDVGVTSIENDLNLPTKNTAECPYVQLYLPTAFQLQDAVEFENFELGRVGAVAEKLITDGVGLGSAAFNAASAGLEAFKNAPSALTKQLDISDPAAGLIGQSVAKKVGLGKYGYGQELAGAVRSVTGTQFNPNTRALFKSVPLRSFNFNFVMVPTSKAEAEQAKRIVRHFREELYPTGLDMAGINYGYKFPNRFVIETKYNDVTIAGLKFLPAYLTGVSTTYNTQGMGMHSDGNFSSTSITLNFTESKALMKQHIQADF